MRALLCSIVGLAATTTGGTGVAQAPAPAPCSTPGHAQFDFWVGDWDVTEQGRLAGRNRIEKVLDGCALLESWQSARQHRGHSLTFYDAPRDLWHQTWIDTAGEPLYLEGRYSDGRMRLEGTRPGKKQGETVLHRIEWTPLPDGRVRQHWRSSSDGGKSWTEVFDGYYARRS